MPARQQTESLVESSRPALFVRHRSSDDHCGYSTVVLSIDG